MSYYQFCLVFFSAYLHQSCLGVQSVYDATAQQSQVHIHDVAEIFKLQAIGCEQFQQLNFFCLGIEAIMCKPLKTFCSVEFHIGASLLQVKNGRRFWQGVILIVDLVKQVCPISVENNEQRSSFQFVEVELVVPVQVLQEVLIAQLESLPRLLHNQDDIGREEDHQVTFENEHIPMLEAIGTAQFLQDADVRALVLNRKALQRTQAYASGPKLKQWPVGFKLWLCLEALLEGDRDSLGLVDVCRDEIFASGVDLPYCMRAGDRHKGDYHDEEDDQAWRLHACLNPILQTSSKGNPQNSNQNHRFSIHCVKTVFLGYFSKERGGMGRRGNCGLDGNGRHTFIYNLIVLMRSMSKLGLAVVLLFVVSAVAQENEDAAYLQMRRTACLVLSRYHSNTQKETIESAVQSLPPTDQNRYINKLYAVAVLTCEESISQSEVQEFYVDNSNFDPSGFFYLLEGVDYGSIASNLDTTKEQDAVIKFAKKFDEEMQIKQEEKKAQSEEGGAEEKYEMKFLGISISDLPESAKLIYVCIFAALVGGALWYGISQLDDKKEKPSNKRRKSPKKDQTKKD